MWHQAMPHIVIYYYSFNIKRTKFSPILLFMYKTVCNSFESILVCTKDFTWLDERNKSYRINNIFSLICLNLLLNFLV